MPSQQEVPHELEELQLAAKVRPAAGPALPALAGSKCACQSAQRAAVPVCCLIRENVCMQRGLICACRSTAAGQLPQRLMWSACSASWPLPRSEPTPWPGRCCHARLSCVVLVCMQAAMQLCQILMLAARERAVCSISKCKGGCVPESERACRSRWCRAPSRSGRTPSRSQAGQLARPTWTCLAVGPTSGGSTSVEGQA